MNVKIFADGADLTAIAGLAADPRIEGFTTNPTLMRQAGVEDYERFAKEVARTSSARARSRSRCSPTTSTRWSARPAIADWGTNVYVKIPVTNTKGERTAELGPAAGDEGVKVNVTAHVHHRQVEGSSSTLADGAPRYVSVFAGRIADAGVDPMPMMRRPSTCSGRTDRRADLGQPPRGAQHRAGRRSAATSSR